MKKINRSTQQIDNTIVLYIHTRQRFIAHGTSILLDTVVVLYNKRGNTYFTLL
jgi:hypothetical protein